MKWNFFTIWNKSVTILYMLLPSLLQISFCLKHLSIVTKLKGSVPKVVYFPLELIDVSKKNFFNKFQMNALNTASHYSYHLPLISGKILPRLISLKCDSLRFISHLVLS